MNSLIEMQGMVRRLRKRRQHATYVQLERRTLLACTGVERAARATGSAPTQRTNPRKQIKNDDEHCKSSDGVPLA
jgi:hypothetical protein